jgi:hypothetical protein
MVERPARGKEMEKVDNAADPLTWLAVLRDDIAHLEQAIASKPDSLKARATRK